jgi:signal transduction histidine kinase/ActR/RegA family two-component response regulator
MKVTTKLLLLFALVLCVVAAGLVIQQRLRVSEMTLILADKERQAEEEFDKLAEMEGKVLQSHVVKEYSLWNEMVEFIEAPAIDEEWKDWLNSNVDYAFEQYPFNVIWIYRRDFSLKYMITGNGADAAAFKASPLPGNIIPKLFEGRKSVHFYFLSPGGIMEVRGATVHPGDDSEKKTPLRGYYVVGRLIDKAFLDDLAALTETTIRLLPQNEASKIVMDRAADRARGLIVFKRALGDWENRPIAQLIVTSASPYMHRIEGAFRQDFVLLSAFILLLAFGLFSFLLVFVSRPLGLISQSLDTNDPGPLERRKKSKDEFGEMASTITAFFKQKDQLLKAREAAEAATRARSEFLAGMSHEIRTPMNAIIGMADLLMDAGPTAEERVLIETIRTAGGSLLSLVNDILDYSKIESGKMELEKQPFDLRECIEAAVAEFRAEADARGLGLALTVAEGTPAVVKGDSTRLRQVLRNLLGNAMKFTIKGEVSVAVAGKPAADGTAEIRGTVRDTGAGIPPERTATLFDPFGSPDARSFGGAGLGLAVTRALVELMGGSIDVESREGEGTTFSFLVRVEEATADDLPAAARESMKVRRFSMRVPKLPSLRILAADDNKVNQKVLLKTLERLGYRADIASNGADVLKALERNPYDVILMDVHMPVMDGLEATKTIMERLPPGSRPRIFAMTASTSSDEVKTCLEAGMEAALSKPIVVDELMDALDRVARDKART